MPHVRPPMLRYLGAQPRIGGKVSEQLALRAGHPHPLLELDRILLDHHRVKPFLVDFVDAHEARGAGARACFGRPIVEFVGRSVRIEAGDEEGRGLHGGTEELETKIRVVDDAAYPSAPKKQVSCFQCLLRVGVEEAHCGEQERDPTALLQVPERLPEKPPCGLLVRRRETVLFAPSGRGRVAASPRWIADHHVVFGACFHAEEIRLAQGRAPQPGQQIAASHQYTDVGRAGLLQQGDIEGERRHAHRTGVDVPAA